MTSVLDGPAAATPPEPAAPPPRRDAEELRGVARAAGEELAGAPAADVIAWAVAEFGSGWAVASSMQDGVLPHLVGALAPGTDVLFLDTGYHFPQTLQTRDAVADRYPGRVRDLRPHQTVAAQDAAYGPALHETNPDLCCLLRKTTPLFDALAPYEAWASGLRRAEASTRAAAAEVSFDERHGIVKIAPLVAWSDAEVAAYIERHDIVVNPLLAQGYPSIGCAPCTNRVAPGADPRSGRWAGRAKTECGIHG